MSTMTIYAWLTQEFDVHTSHSFQVPCILTILGCTLVRDCTCICKGFDKLANKADKGGAPAEQVLDAEIEEGVVMNQMQR